MQKCLKSDIAKGTEERNAKEINSFILLLFLLSGEYEGDIRSEIKEHQQVSKVGMEICVPCINEGKISIK